MKIKRTSLVKYEDRKELSNIEILGLNSLAYAIQNKYEDEFGIEKTSFENVISNLFYSDKAVQSDLYLNDMKIESLFMVEGKKEVAFGYTTELDKNYKETDKDFIVMISL